MYTVYVNSGDEDQPKHYRHIILTQRPVVYYGRHAGDEFGAGVAHQRAGHALRPLVAAVPLVGLLPAVGGRIASVEHLHGGVARHQGHLETNRDS